MEKILVIDGNSIINRAFFGVRPLTTKSGKNTNAVFGTINIISRQLDLIKPDYAVVAFDLKEKTFRHVMYPEYKAGRNPTPPELLEQFPEVKECLNLMGLNIMELPGYEADDIQGTVASLAHKHENIESYVLSGDRDLLQLIDDKITVLLATNHDTLVMHEAEFEDKYGISADLFVDMKALMGDKSDNIPGVKGIGEKTAAALISDFGTLEGIYENIESEKISKSVRAKLIEFKEDAFLSRKLARIEVNAPIGKTLGELRRREMDRGGLYKKFSELELNSMITKFKLSAADISPEDRAHEKNTQRPTVSVAEQISFALDECIPEGRKEDYCIEMKEISEGELSLLDGKALTLYEGEDGIHLYFEDEEYIFRGDTALLAEPLKNIRSIITYDAKRLLHTLAAAGVELCESATLYDLLLYAYVLNPGTGNSTLDSLLTMFLGITPGEGGINAYMLYKLEAAMRKKVEEDGLLRVLDELELPLIRVLFETERYGFKINIDGMNEFAEALDGLAEELKNKIYSLAGGEFNINSPKQLGEVLFVNLGLPHNKKKNKNGFSTDAETLEELRAYSPIIDDILEYRQVTKLRGTYAAALPKLADENHRIHTEFKQALTATGRLSSIEPNLQNIPIRTAMGREMRRYFIADEGRSLVDADYSQIELRLLAHISDDYNMKDAFLRGADIHRETASRVFMVPEDEVTDEMRKRAKAVNFGIVYGIGGFSLAKDIGTTTKEATQYIKSYLLNYPFIDVYLEKVVEDAKETGYTKTEFGRRRYIPELRASNGMLRAFGKRVAMNAPIQGTAADIMKLAMINVYKRLKKDAPEAKIVMQVHDELIVECPDELTDKVSVILKEEMENAYKISIPLSVDVSVGKNWLEQE